MKLLTLFALLCMVALTNAALCIDFLPAQGVQSAEGCSCYSGFTGDDCSVNSAGSCDTIPTVAPLTTEAIATMGSTSILNKDFNFALSSPARIGRYFHVALNNNQVNCGYPGSPSFTRTFDTNSCSDVFSGQFTVDDTINVCGSEVTGVEGAIHVAGTIDITAFDQLPSFRGVSISRATHSAVSYLITVPTVVNASADGLSIVSPIDLMGAVTFQDYNQTDDSFTILLVTSVQIPYILSSEGFSISTTSFSVSIMRSDDGSQCLVGSGDCTQEFEITIGGISTGGCQGDGDYSFHFNGGCRGGVECPGASEASISFTLDTDNVCSSVELTANIAASLASFSDDSFSTPQSSFLPNSVLYFTATVDADVTVSSVSVVQVTVVQSGVPQAIYVGGVQVDPSLNFGTSGDANTAFFSFTAVTTPGQGFFIFDSSVGDATFSFDVEVDLEVVYDVTFTRKRTVQTKTFSVSRHLLLSQELSAIVPKSSMENSASTASFTAGSVVAAAAVGVAALF